MSASRIAELADLVRSNTLLVDGYLKANKLASPSFDEHGPQTFGITDPAIEKARLTAIEAGQELNDLLMGPAMVIRPTLNAASLQAIWKYEVPRKVPLDGRISFEALARECGLPEPDLRRLLRHAMIFYRIFQEKERGFVSHSAASRRLVEDPPSLMGVGHMFDECYQAFAHTIEALDKSRSSEPNQTGWNIANNTDVSMFQYHEQHPELAKRFAGTMSTFTKGIGMSTAPLVTGYPWSDIRNGNGKVVDVGGSTGFVADDISRAHPNLNFVVQDTPKVIEQAKLEEEPAALNGKIEFMAHDFLAPQPIVADAYLFRQIFHNWSDVYALRILRALVPALRPGAKVVVNDYLVPEPGTMTLLQERRIRHMDLIMMALFNARDREAEEWKSIFAEADPRFGDVRVWTPPGAFLAIIEATWMGDGL